MSYLSAEYAGTRLEVKPLLEETEAKQAVSARSSYTSSSTKPLTKNAYYVPDFEREPFEFELNLNDQDVSHTDLANIKTIHNLIKTLTGDRVHRWKYNVPECPASITGESEDTQMFQASDLFILPAFNEMDALAVDEEGKKKPLDQIQLDSISKRGEFDVLSHAFPGKSHTWRLAKWLQKGYVKSNESFFNDLSKALQLLIITAKRRFTSKNFSILSGFKAWKSVIFNALDILIGMPQRYVSYTDANQKGIDEMQRFLCEELRVDPFDMSKYNDLCNKIILMLELEYLTPEPSEVLHCPCFYRTPNNVLIDLRLLDKHLQTQIKPILHTILAESSIKLELHRLKQTLITQYREEGLANKEIVEKTNQVLFDEYLRLIFVAIENSQELEAVSQGIGLLLVEHAKSLIVMKSESDKLAQELSKHLASFEERLRKKYPIKSLVRDWLYDCVKEEREKFEKLHLYTAHERSIGRCTEEGLFQAAYFIERELLFLREVILFLNIFF